MARACNSVLCVVLAACLMSNAICAPAPVSLPSKDRLRLYRDALNDDLNEITNSPTSSTPDPFFGDDDDDDDFGTMQTSSGGGSSIFSLLNLVSALFPSSSGPNAAFRNVIRQYLLRRQQPVDIRKKDVADNVIEIDYVKHLTPPFQRQEDDESDSHDDDDDDNDDDDDGHEEDEDSNEAAEESVENNKEDENDKASQQDSNGDGSNEDSDSGYDEPESDGQGGGLLGLLAGLSGGEGGSDLGTLLATVSQIVGDLSGDGFDLNALITSGLGLFVGLLSQDEQNPGAVISSYLLTSLDTITGGGAQNNGAFFGKFLSSLLKGVSAAEGESGESSEEGDEKEKMADSAGFFMSLLMSLSGDMSKSSSGGSSHPWPRQRPQAPTTQCLHYGP